MWVQVLLQRNHLVRTCRLVTARTVLSTWVLLTRRMTLVCGHHSPPDQSQLHRIVGGVISTSLHLPPRHKCCPKHP
jgi:hypothetical protein